MRAAEIETGYGAMPDVGTDFPWRYVTEVRLHHAEYRSFDVAVEGWSERSTWHSGMNGDEASLVPDGSGADPVVVPAQSDCSTSRMPLVLAVVEYLDRDPETVLAGMGLAAPQPVTIAPEAIRGLLDGHERDHEYSKGQRTALRWLLGEEDRRPGSGRAWAGGEPAPWVVSAERDMAPARRARGESPEWLAGVADQLDAVIGIAGPLVPAENERSWPARRLLGESAPPSHREDPYRLCHVRRGTRFRSWELIAEEGVLGAVLPDGVRRWVATVDGAPLSGRVHRSVSAAAYEIALEAYRSGRARSVATQPTSRPR